MRWINLNQNTRRFFTLCLNGHLYQNPSLFSLVSASKHHLEDSHMKKDRSGYSSKTPKRASKKYQDPVYWVWLTLWTPILFIW